jgi:hypothetical protein
LILPHHHSQNHHFETLLLQTLSPIPIESTQNQILGSHILSQSSLYQFYHQITSIADLYQSFCPFYE